jgi:hypothetical protein
MPDRGSPITALIWEIWARKRTSGRIVIGITLFNGLLNRLLPASIQATASGRLAIGLLNFHCAVVVFILVLGIFGYTESNAQKGSSGFPYRLFTLPVTSLRLVAVPMFGGVAATELLWLAWAKLGFVTQEQLDYAWLAVLIGTYLVLYQTILWTLSALGSLRMIVLGVVGIIFITCGFLPSFPHRDITWWISEGFLMRLLFALAACGFVACWIYVARQRSGGSDLRRFWFGVLADRLSDLLPRREKAFNSPASAHFWFEWRRSGFVLPLLVGGLLITVIGPMSWFMRSESSNGFGILLASLAMPLMCALPVGKAFSKPDFWSADLSIPSFVAVRPLAAADIVVIKLRVAAVSVAISWLLVLAFLSLWLPLWANLSSLNLIRGTVWQLSGRSVYPQYAIAGLLIVGGVFISWRFLVGSLWLGLSGNGKLFSVSAIPYVFIPVAGLPVLVWLARHDQSLFSWIQHNLGRRLSELEWFAAVFLIAKLWLSAFAWRDISPVRVRRYLFFWLGSTFCLIALAMLLSSVFLTLLPLDAYRVRNFCILVALLLVPLARLGLAPSSLARNRHRGRV